MRYLRGYVTAAILALITLGLTAIAKRFSVLVDMVYPYVTRFLQNSLADWSGSVDFTLWQVLVVLIILAVVATIVLMIIFKWNFFEWLGWVLAGASCIWMLHTGVYGLNYHSGPLADDIRLTISEFTAEDMEDATIFFRDKANELALQIQRDEGNMPIYPSFEELAEMAGDGFDKMTYTDSLSVFAGSRAPVKRLAWADMYTAMGICGVTMPLTGEAAVNPQIPAVALPFTMCHELAHRLCIAMENDANLAGFLACIANERIEYQYSAYYMAYRYCYSAMVSSGSSADAVAAARIHSGVNEQFRFDLKYYDDFFQSKRNQTANSLANTVNDSYIKVSGDEEGIASYGNVASLLVNWYIQEQVLPFEVPDDTNNFDPLDKDQVDVSDIPR